MRPRKESRARFRCNVIETRASSGRLGELALPILVALATFAVLIALGTWQLERKAQKEAFIDMLEERLSAPPAPLPPPERWAALDRQSDEFRRVRFSAAFVPGTEALVYAAGSGWRDEALGPGYRVFAEARLASGKPVAIDRGFVPAGRNGNPSSGPGAASTAAPEPATGMEMIGVMRWPEMRGYFAPQDDPGRNLWFVRDHLAIAAAKGWGEVAPFYVTLEAPAPAGGWPRPGPLHPNIRNEHLQYALTWYGLAAVLVIMFAVWLRHRQRETSTVPRSL